MKIFYRFRIIFSIYFHFILFGRTKKVTKLFTLCQLNKKVYKTNTNSVFHINFVEQIHCYIHRYADFKEENQTLKYLYIAALFLFHSETKTIVVLIIIDKLLYRGLKERELKGKIDINEIGLFKNDFLSQKSVLSLMQFSD